MSLEGRRIKMFYGWWVVIACGIIGILSSSSRFSFTMFLPTLMEDLNWPMAELSFGFTISWWMTSLTSLVIGFIVDRVGPRLVMTLGGLFTLIGLVLTSRITTVWEFYLYYGIILAVGGGMSHGVPATSTARKWFQKRAGLAVSISSVGGGMGLGLIALVAPGLIRLLGWRGSWLFLGIFLGLAIMLIATFVIRKDPESLGLLPDGDYPSADNSVPAHDDGSPLMAERQSFSMPEAARTRSYWCLIFGHALISVPLMGGLTHMAAWGVDITRALNIPEESGIQAVQFSIFLSAMAAVLAALVGGPLSDRVGRKPVFTASFIMYGASMLYGVMVTTYIPSLLGVILFNLAAGFFYGLGMSLWTVYIGDIFGSTHLGTLTGLNFFIGGMIGGTGAVIYGFFHDLTGSYAAAFAFGAGCCLLTLMLITLTRAEEKQ